MSGAEVARRKLRKLSEYTSELSLVAGHSYEEYLGDIFVKRTAERSLQLIVECATDVCDHLLAELNHPPPKDYHESFIKAGEAGIISSALAKEIAPSAGLRNVIVHEYEDIKDEKVYESIGQALRSFRQFIKEVNDFIMLRESK
jgi:uncharacterized protein YutE (UPF0331/DUF86 family)